MRPLDLRSWNLLAASLALAACQADGYGYDDEGEWGDDGYYECNYWTDCGLGGPCVDGVCETAPEPIECVVESLIEIPLPQLEPALAITFANLDGESGDELVSIGASGVSVVLADDSVVLTPWPETHDYAWVTALELQGDDSLDLAVGFPTGMLLLAGTGDGGFVHPTTHGSLPTITVARAIDVDGDGIDQLVAALADGTSPMWFTDVTMGSWNPLSQYSASTLTLANLVGDYSWQPEILAARDCDLQIFKSTDYFARVAEYGGYNQNLHCDWHVTVLGGTGNALISVMLDTTTHRTQLGRFDFPEHDGTFALIKDLRATASTLVDLHGAGEPLLALGSDTSLALVWDWSHFPEPCIDHLDGAADSLLAGDRNGDGRQELAIVHEGAIRLLQLP